MKACRGMFFGLAAAGLLGGVVLAETRPDKGGSVVPNSSKMRAHEPNAAVNYTSSSAGFPKCESTGFEAIDGICAWEAGTGLCGSTFTCKNTCTDGLYPTTCIGPPTVQPDNCCVTNPHPINDWFMSASAQHCQEPHIDTIHPANPGGQHLRFSRSLIGGNPCGAVCTTGGTAQPGACRQSAFTPNINPAFPTVMNPGVTTTSWDISRDIAPGLPGMEILFSNQSNSEGYIAQLLRVDIYGYVATRDFFLAGWAYLGALDPLSGNDGYHTVSTTFDQCVPAGVGEQRYYFDGLLMYTMAWSGVQSIEQYVYLAGNQGGANIDFDNFVVTRLLSPDPFCPSVCGDGVVTGNEECDNGDPGDDSCCPGACQPDCSCPDPTNTLFTCLPRAVVNGENGPYITDGGFYSYVADAPFTSVETCGSDFDSQVFWNITPDCAQYEFFNDECTGDDFGGYQDVGDPNASCYVPAAPPFPLASCLCVATPPGTYTFLVGEYDAVNFSTFIPPRCSSTLVTITKKTSCDLGGPIPGGACCNQYTGDCTDGGEADACVGPYDVYSDNKLCDMVGCDIIYGSCCNTAPGAGGACSITLEAECPTSQYQSWTSGGSCDGCAEVTGACCNALTGFCSITIQGDCAVGGDVSWTEGGTCSTCTAATGACCVDDGLATANCTDGVTQAACTGEWTRGVACDALEDPCAADFIPIPTVSEWGLAVLALMLLIGGKIYFSRREAATA